MESRIHQEIRPVHQDDGGVWGIARDDWVDWGSRHGAGELEGDNAHSDVISFKPTYSPLSNYLAKGRNFTQYMSDTASRAAAFKSRRALSLPSFRLKALSVLAPPLRGLEKRRSQSRGKTRGTQSATSDSGFCPQLPLFASFVGLVVTVGKGKPMGGMA
jgi:hypothetical protein